MLNLFLVQERIVQMSNYTGTKCISCGELFKDGDDVVVCPECGTPYHRECYLREGKCINEALHASGQSWNQEQGCVHESETSEENESAENIRCIRCGFENTPEKLFCEKCGTPLMKNMSDERPFNTADGQGGFNRDMNGFGGMNGFNGSGMDGGPMGAQAFGRTIYNQDSDIDGVKLGDYAKYVGGNPISFLSNFIRFGKFGGKLSLNLGAVLFPEVYFLYRKMKPWGILALLLFALLSIPNLIYAFSSGIYGVTMDVGVNIKSQNFIVIYNIAAYATLFIRIAAGLIANYLYYKQAKKDITKIREEEISDDSEAKLKIAAKGGVSWAAVIVGLTVYAVISFGTVMLMSRMM